MKHAVDIGAMFLQAALEPHRWIAALGMMADATGSLRGQLLGIDRRGELVFNYITNIDDGMIDDFTAIEGHHGGAVNYRVAASAPVGHMVYEADYAREQALTGWTPYIDVCEKHRQPFGCQTSIANDEGRLVGLALLRSRHDGPTTEEQRALFAAIAPSVRAAVNLQAVVEGRGAELVRGALDAVGASALLIDGFGRVMAATPAAERALAATRRLRVSGTALVASTASQTAEIYAALGRVLQGQSPAAGLVLRGGGEPPLRLDIQPLPRADWELGFRPSAILVLKGTGTITAKQGDALQLEFGLTASEAEVALALASGVPRAHIADLRRTSLGTVRQQIKSIFAKMGVNREAEFMALIATYISN